MADLIVQNAKITTLDRANPAPRALAVADGRIAAIGDDTDVMPLRTASTRVVDAGGRRLIPGLIDSHIHVVRGGLHYAMELRWDGVRSLAEAMRMLRRQVEVTPAPQWVRVVGGFSERQFAEKRLPTLDELNRAAPDTPVFILHLYDRALLNGAALRACGYDESSPDPPGGRIERDRHGRPTGLLLAKPNAFILYATLAKGPTLPPDDQALSSRHFMRELNRLGVTSVIDAGGGFQRYPEDYRIIHRLAAEDALTLRIAYNLFPQRAGEELADFERWAGMVQPGAGDDLLRHNGAGEMLVFSAADFEDFREPRPDLPGAMEGQLERVVRLLAEKRWPWRLHATYDETISRALDVFERVRRDIPFHGLNWFFDHAETISDRNIDRVAALGGGIAIQHRMAYQGEWFVERYGAQVAERTPPIARMRAAGLPLAAGTDATRVASYNPWVSLSWLVTGQTVGGLSLYPSANRVDRETALRLWTECATWFSNELGKKGRLSVGQLADFAVLSDDYFAIPESAIQDITSVLTVLGGRIVHGAGPYGDLAPPLPPAAPDWSRVRTFGGYQHTRDGALAALHSAALPSAALPSTGGTIAGPAADFDPGCLCWAF